MHRLLASSLVGTFFAATAIAQCANSWRDGFVYPGIEGAASAGVMWDPDGAGPRTEVLVVAGSFATVGTAPAQNLATYDPATGVWQEFGGGLSGPAWSLAVAANGDLLVGGDFAMAGSAVVNRLARWDGNGWSSIGGGSLASQLHSLTELANGDVLCFGTFVDANGQTFTGIGRWDGVAWTELGSQTNAVMTCKVAPNGDVYAGGSFQTIGGVVANHLARWDGSTWSAVGGGVNGNVLALHLTGNGDLWVGGAFDHVGVTPAFHLARWDGTAWGSPLGGVLGIPWVIDSDAAGKVYVGGATFSIPGVPGTDNLASWDGNAWHDVDGGASNTVYGLCMGPNQDLYAIGSFLRVGGLESRGIAHFDGAVWHGLFSGLSGAIETVLELPNGDLIVGGYFTSAGGVLANNIARWDGTTWHPLGLGVSGPVKALALRANGDLLVGGSFATAGGQLARYLASWDGTNWSTFGNGADGTVTSLVALDNGDFYVGGLFSAIEGVVSRSVIRHSNGTWLPLGPTGNAGTNLLVYDMAQLDGDLIVAGAFGSAGGVNVSNVARWDGVTWSPIGDATFGLIHTITTLANGHLVVGANCTLPSSTVLTGPVVFDGTSWSQLGSGLSVTAGSGAIRDVVQHPGGDLFATGTFPTVSPAGVFANLARWNGSAWTTTNGGLDRSGYCLAIARDGDLLVGGEFTHAGGQVSAYFAQLTTDCPADVQGAGAGCAGSGGNNVLSGSAPWLGGVWTVTGTELPSPSIVVIANGLMAASLPLANVLPTALPGCTLHVDPGYLGLALSTTGTVTASFPLPGNPTLAGVQLYTQMIPFELDPQGNLGEITASNALVVTTGAF